ncbi:hypothetical protein [Streptomyces sp. CB03234]|uniref:hypothetical protein n=1 Tax=Streptomyces sp. (strain CB03234) TaxID=1703937 RepID=UPI00117E206A|nr:hypothetical protein [Streptomyces sp. CB03234]
MGVLAGITAAVTHHKSKGAPYLAHRSHRTPAARASPEHRYRQLLAATGRLEKIVQAACHDKRAILLPQVVQISKTGVMFALRTALRSLAVLAVVIGVMTGCAAKDADKSSGGGDTETEVIQDANTTMNTTSFHATGTTTAFSGGKQEIWSDPDKGFHLRATGEGSTGDLYCKDGTTYTSAPLLADMLKQRGQAITVPDRLKDVYVTTETGQGCDTYYKISESGQHTPAKDRNIGGRPTMAIQVFSGNASDTYFIEKGTSRLLVLESFRDGRTSTTTYDSFGDKFTMDLPAKDRTMPLDEFRTQVTGG